MNNKTTKAEKINLILAFLLGLTLASLILFFNYINNQFKDFTIKRQEYNQSVANTRSLQKVNEELKFVQRAEKFFDNLYVKSDDIVDFISQIEEMARNFDTSIKINSINSKTVKVGDEHIKNYNLVEINLEVAGSWQDINNYIETVENLPHHVDIRELKIAKGLTDEEVYEVGIKFNVITK